MNPGTAQRELAAITFADMEDSWEWPEADRYGASMRSVVQQRLPPPPNQPVKARHVPLLALQDQQVVLN